MDHNLDWIEGLDVLHIKSQSDSAEKTPAVLIFHGYGADAFNLGPLAEMCSPSKNWDWYFPQGLKEVHLGGGQYGRAWFDIDMNAIQRAMMSGTHRDLTNDYSNDLPQIRKQILDLVKVLQQKHSQLYIGGFSQGSMLSVELALHMEPLPAGLLVLSGNLVNQSEWSQLMPKLKGLRVFQSHGKNDPILSFEGGRKLNTLMQKSGVRLTFCDFVGEHEIPPEICHRIQKFLKSGEVAPEHKV